jgi:hypothetical protein
MPKNAARGGRRRRRRRSGIFNAVVASVECVFPPTSATSLVN